MDKEPRMTFPYTDEELNAARAELKAKAEKLKGSLDTHLLGQTLEEVAAVNNDWGLGAYLIFEQAIEEQKIKEL